MSTPDASPRCVTSDGDDDVPQTPVVADDDGALLSTELANLSVHAGASGVHHDAAGSYSTDHKKSRPAFSPPFIRRNVGSPKDDPFGSPSKSHVHSPNLSIDKKQAMEGHWRVGRSDSSSSTDSFPKESQLGTQLSRGPVNSAMNVRAELAQSLYPPICCVFVANLLQTESDESLEASVTEIFRDFGKVWVKVRRDHKNMPFAFCQYTNVDNAERAIIAGNGRLINGRPCRCEQAKAHRIFYIERKYGAIITPNEAMEAFGVFGDIVLCRSATPTERATLDANAGVIIEYSMYDHGQNAFNAFKNHAVYKISPLASMTKERSSVVRKSPTYTPAQARAIIDTYDIDRRSIFVGSLFVGISEEDVRQLFNSFGTILEVTIREMRSKYNSEAMAFAFVEFQTPIATDNAIQSMHGFKLSDRSGNARPIRVFQKDSKASISRPAGNFSTVRSPASAMQTPPVPITPQSMTPITPATSSGYASAYPYGSAQTPAWPPYGGNAWAQGCEMGWGQSSSPYGYAGYPTTGYTPAPTNPSPYHTGVPAGSPYHHSSAPINTPAGYSTQWYFYPGYGYVPYNLPSHSQLAHHETSAHAHPYYHQTAVTEENRSPTTLPAAPSSAVEAKSA